MFNINAENSMDKSPKVIATHINIETTTDIYCLKASNTAATIRETFKFIKEKQNSSSTPLSKTYIQMGLWLQANQSNQLTSSVITSTLISGIITKVYDTYAELSYTNSAGKLIKTIVSYNGIVFFYSNVIIQYLEDYISTIAKLPPLCKNPLDENFTLLERLGTLLENPNTNTAFDLILDGVLAGGINTIAIVRNLIIINELYIIPITSISGFLQKGLCNN